MSCAIQMGFLLFFQPPFSAAVLRRSFTAVQFFLLTFAYGWWFAWLDSNPVTRMGRQRGPISHRWRETGGCVSTTSHCPLPLLTLTTLFRHPKHRLLYPLHIAISPRPTLRQPPTPTPTSSCSKPPPPPPSSSSSSSEDPVILTTNVPILQKARPGHPRTLFGVSCRVFLGGRGPEAKHRAKFGSQGV